MSRSIIRFVIPHLLTVFASCLSGCASLRGATDTLDPQGPTSLSGKNNYVLPLNIETASPGAVGLFEVSYSQALKDQQTISFGRKGPKTSDELPSIHARQMAVDGMGLVDEYCARFFRTSGNSQKWLNVSKDLTAVIGTAVTGVLALSSPANAAASGAAALTTATVYNGVDLYTRNFLFGSDNIESVRLLVMNALAAHTSKLLPLNDNSVWSFGNAAEAINDHQDLCSPASIHSLVLAAIRGGTVTAYQPAGTVLGSPSAAGSSALPTATAAGTSAVALTPASANAPAAAAAASLSSALSQVSTPPVGGATPATIESTIRQLALQSATNAALANHAPLAQAQAIGRAVTNVIVPAVANAASPNPAPSSRHVTMDVNGQVVNP